MRVPRGSLGFLRAYRESPTTTTCSTPPPWLWSALPRAPLRGLPSSCGSGYQAAGTCPPQGATLVCVRQCSAPRPPNCAPKCLESCSKVFPTVSKIVFQNASHRVPKHEAGPCPEQPVKACPSELSRPSRPPPKNHRWAHHPRSWHSEVWASLAQGESE